MKDEVALSRSPSSVVRRPSPAGEQGTRGLWFGVLAGPVAWTAHLLLSYALLPPACASGLFVMLHGVTLASVLVSVAGAATAHRRWRALRSEAGGGGFLLYTAACGIMLSALFAFITLLEGLPVFFLDPCTATGHRAE